MAIKAQIAKDGAFYTTTKKKNSFYLQQYNSYYTSFYNCILANAETS